jgi:hypothetical protein
MVLVECGAFLGKVGSPKCVMHTSVVPFYLPGTCYIFCPTYLISNEFIGKLSSSNDVYCRCYEVSAVKI